jgi:hypothetical protein
MTTRIMTRAGRIGVVVGMLLTAACATVTGPITGPGDISLLIGPDPALIGYQRSEFFQSGIATSYAPAVPLTNDGKWQLARDASTAAQYKTRFVVYRPVDASRFNGTVVVEWLNVSTGRDVPSDWIMAHNEFVRSGSVWVGVSAQAVGVNTLRALGGRYSSLAHPGDSYSYDIFSHAGQRIRNEPDKILGGLAPQRVLATGESQSAGRLVTYINGIHPTVDAFDGYMVHSRGAGGAPLAQAPLPEIRAPSPLQIRNDLDVPVMVVQAEGDVINSNLGARQPDTTYFRAWEMAGTSHADAYTTSVGFSDIGDGNGARQMFDLMRDPPELGCAHPINAGPHHWILQAAFHGLDNWARTGVAPAVGPPLVVASTSPVLLARDAHGNALGGIRSPHVDAPVATLLGTNEGPDFCRLFGTTTPFTSAQLAALYPTHEDFVWKWSLAVYGAVINGFLLPADGTELTAAASESQIPN